MNLEQNEYFKQNYNHYKKHQKGLKNRYNDNTTLPIYNGDKKLRKKHKSIFCDNDLYKYLTFFFVILFVIFFIMHIFQHKIKIHDHTNQQYNENSGYIPLDIDNMKMNKINIPNEKIRDSDQLTVSRINFEHNFFVTIDKVSGDQFKSFKYPEKYGLPDLDVSITTAYKICCNIFLKGLKNEKEDNIKLRSLMYCSNKSYKFVCILRNQYLLFRIHKKGLFSSFFKDINLVSSGKKHVKMSCDFIWKNPSNEKQKQ